MISAKNKITYINNRSVQYDSDNSRQIVFFGLLNAKEEEMASDVTAVVKIVNNNDETVYNKTINVDEDDFAEWDNYISGEKYLASIYIRDKDIEAGSSSEGKLSLEVYNKDQNVYFDKMELQVTNLPFEANASLKYSSLPTEISNFSYSGEKYTTFKLTNIDYEFSENYSGTLDLQIKYSGQKTYDYEQSDNYCIFAWKLYKDDIMIDSGTEYIDKLKTGEKVENEGINIYDIPEGDYRIEFISD